MFQRRRTVARAATIALAGALTLGPLAPPVEALSPVEKKLVQRVNGARQSHGLRRLRVSAWLAKKAQGHSNRMARQGRLFHTRCLSCMFRSRRWDKIGENVGVGNAVRQIHRAMMRSPAHRSNVLGRGFHHLGVGIRKNRRGLWVTEIFWG
jgi:uncharacterized protein YkwD